ncbi:MAG: hypothetical protein WC572_05200, partial [Candidatus Omnitrophota bacterium]
RGWQEAIDRRCEKLNSGLDNLNASCANIDRQLSSLFQMQTRELQETLEQKSQALNNELGVITGHLKPFSHAHAKMWLCVEKASEALKALERDLIIVSDIMERNAKFCFKQEK